MNRRSKRAVAIPLALLVIGLAATGVAYYKGYWGQGGRVTDDPIVHIGDSERTGPPTEREIHEVQVQKFLHLQMLRRVAGEEIAEEQRKLSADRYEARGFPPGRFEWPALKAAAQVHYRDKFLSASNDVQRDMIRDWALRDNVDLGEHKVSPEKQREMGELVSQLARAKKAKDIEKISREISKLGVSNITPGALKKFFASKATTKAKVQLLTLLRADSRAGTRAVIIDVIGTDLNKEVRRAGLQALGERPLREAEVKKLQESWGLIVRKDAAVAKEFLVLIVPYEQKPATQAFLRERISKSSNVSITSLLIAHLEPMDSKSQKTCLNLLTGTERPVQVRKAALARLGWASSSHDVHVTLLRLGLAKDEQEGMRVSCIRELSPSVLAENKKDLAKLEALATGDTSALLRKTATEKVEEARKKKSRQDPSRQSQRAIRKVKKLLATHQAARDELKARKSRSPEEENTLKQIEQDIERLTKVLPEMEKAAKPKS